MDVASPKKVVLLCDFGLDDAAAVTDLFLHGKDLASVDILAVGGNFPADMTRLHGRHLLSYLKAPCPVRLVSTTEIPQNAEKLFFIHGNDGMGDVLPKEEGPFSVTELTFSVWMNEKPAVDVLVSLGALTVAARILREIKVGAFLFMGGCVDGVPNYRGYEFNHGIDTAAFREAVTYPHRAVLLDTATAALDVSERALPQKGLFYDFVRAYRDLCQKNGEKGCYVWDDIAIRYLLHPEDFTVSEKVDRDGNRLNALSYVGPCPFC